MTTKSKLSDKAVEWINGELLGDGCLISKVAKSARFYYKSKYLEYVQYVSVTLDAFGIKQSGSVNSYYYKDMDCWTYQYASHSHRLLKPLYDMWYPEGKKIVPRGLFLSSTVCRQWYIGDGCLAHCSRNAYINLATCSFSKYDVEWLCIQLGEVGFLAVRQPSNNTIRISRWSTKDFLNYIGDCPVKCYEYKWDLTERRDMKGNH